MKFTKSVDGKRRASVMVEYRVGHTELLTAACAMVAHNRVEDLLEVCGNKIAGVERKPEGKKTISRLSIVNYLKAQYKIQCDIDDIGSDFESNAESIAWLLNNHTNPDVEWTAEDVCADIETEAEKLVSGFYPELKKGDR